MAWQVVVNALTSAFALAPLALGFTIVAATSGHLPFGLVLAFTGAPYVAIAAASSFGWPLPASLALGLCAGGLLGAALEAGITGPLRKKGGGPTVSVVVALGLILAFQSAVALTFGDSTLVLRTWPPQPPIDVVGQATISPLQIAAIVVGLTCYVVVWLVRRLTIAGLLQRAVANDADLAGLHGVPVAAVRVLVYSVGGMLAAVAGLLGGLDTDLVPTMGFSPVLTAMAAAVVGGVGSVRGALVGSLIVASCQHLAVMSFSGEWQDPVAFVVLAVALVVRPTGLWGEELRRARA
jgi:branched-chain amino acid transport system permease protein